MLISKNLCKQFMVITFSVLVAQVTWAEKAIFPPVTTGMTLLLDASDMNADGDVDTGVVNDSNVTIWNDKSSVSDNNVDNDNNVFPITNSTDKEPKRVLNGLNGKTVVSFKESGLTPNDQDQILGNSDYTKFVVFKINVSNNSNNLISSDTTALWTGQVANNDIVGSLKSWHGGDNYLADTLVVSTKDFHITSTRYGKPAIPSLSNVLRLDGKVVASNTLEKAHATANTYIGSIGDGNFLDGSIAEAIIYDRALTDVEIKNVEDYLKSKWGGLKENIVSLVVGSESKEMGDTISLTAKATSNLPVTLTSATPGICSIQAGTTKASLDAIGTCTIDANQAGDDTYQSATKTSKTFNVVAAEKESSGGSTSVFWLMMLGLVTLARRK